MTLRLVVLSSPVPQPRPELRLESGRAVLGREADCDWPLADPQMFVSRRHCIVAAGAAGWIVTDTSSGGLYLDDAALPLGQGQSAPLRDGMRLRLGEVLLAVAIDAPAPDAPPLDAAPAETGMGLDPFFAPRDTPPPPQPRPADLPEPFERTSGRHVPPPPPTPPPGFDDPFTLGRLDPPPIRSEAVPLADRTGWDWGPATAPTARPPEPEPEPAPMADPAPDAAMAFLRGAGLDPDQAEALDFEALGRRYRMLAEGLVAMLRARTEEKSSLRIARTTLGGSQVNPLKFLAMPQEQVAALIAARSPGYLDPDAAIAEALRDLADHRMRSWQGLQAALRRMIDRFAPETIEAELADAGPMRALLAGGRSALVWEAYCARWAEIARAAEDRFLGEVGAEFRDAYEATDRRET